MAQPHAKKVDLKIEEAESPIFAFMQERMLNSFRAQRAVEWAEMQTTLHDTMRVIALADVDGNGILGGDEMAAAQLKLMRDSGGPDCSDEGKKKMADTLESFNRKVSEYIAVVKHPSKVGEYSYTTGKAMQASFANDVGVSIDELPPATRDELMRIGKGMSQRSSEIVLEVVDELKKQGKLSGEPLRMAIPVDSDDICRVSHIKARTI